VGGYLKGPLRETQDSLEPYRTTQGTPWESLETLLGYQSLYLCGNRLYFSGFSIEHQEI
jgi:hypothetical protein